MSASSLHRRQSAAFVSTPAPGVAAVIHLHVGCRLATPMRTPRITGASGEDRIMAEAQNLARLQAGETPLKGGVGPELSSSDFGGVTPRAQTATTPHPLATPRGDGQPSIRAGEQWGMPGWGP